jgi:hypothetical protein
MPGGAGQLSSGGGGQGRGAGVVTAEPSWLAERPRRRDPARSGRPAGVAGREDVRTSARPGRCPVRLVRSAVGVSVQPVERTSSIRASGVQASGVQASGVQASGVSRCPDGQASGVRGAAAALDLEWLGVAGRPGWAQRVDVPPWSVGGVVACLHRAGREGMVRRWPWLARTRVDVAQGHRLAGVPAAVPPWPQRADTGAGPGPGCGGGAWEGAGAHRPPQGVLGRSPAWCPTMGLDQEVVTTLRGRWARVVPWRPAPEGLLGLVGEQPAAAARPQRVRSAVP